MDYSHIQKQDEEVIKAILGEEKRQAEGLELIPSENYVSQAVRETLASAFTNKYSEGYPGKRYYGGQDYTDQIETIAIERAKNLFGANFANVQPLSGAPANLALYAALLEPGDTVLGMDLSHGGHLTHGHPVTFPAKIFNFVRYKIKDLSSGEIDYDELAKVAQEVKPKIVLGGFSSYSRELDYQKLADIAHEVGAYAVMDAAHIAGLIAGGALTNPFDAGFDVITMTTHKTLRGPRGGMIVTKENEEIAKKIDKAVFPGLQGGPHMNVIAAKAVAFGEAQTENFKQYAVQVLKNAKAMEKTFKEKGVEIVNGGTDNHLLLVDVVKSFGIGGKEAQELLDRVGITLNMNVIPDDPQSPMNPSGIRLGTPAITTRGFTETTCTEVAEIIVNLLQNPASEDLLASSANRVKELAIQFPIPETFV